MPTLDWIGKKAVLNHHREVPYRIMTEESTLSYGQKDSGNLIVEGDNLEALRALLPYYKGKVKCIYIDPPYNTGEEKWVYNDNVNSPEIKKWLGKVVGREMEDLSRHDKWLCMMYPRLSLLKEFLCENGAIFISLDDNEQPSLRFILDEILGSHNFVATFIWKKKGTSTNVRGVSTSTLTEYITCYKKKNSAINLRVKSKKTRMHPCSDELGNYRTTVIEKKGEGEYARATMLFEILGQKPRDGKRWQIGLELARELEKKNRFILDNGIVKLKIYDFEEKDTFSAQPNILEFEDEGTEDILENEEKFWDKYGSTEKGTKDLKAINSSFNFDNPKPVELIKHIINISSDKDSIILDSFAGSGTTAQAVMELNKEDGGNRKFVCVEMLPEIAENVTSKRAQRVIDKLKIKDLEGFKFVRLGEQMFSANGDINPKIGYADLARHVFFMATGTPLDSAKTEFDSPLVGVSNDVAIYLLYNGILKDSSVQGGNRLTQKVLATLPKHNGVKIIYGTACGLSESVLRKNNIVFRQIPYTIFDR